MSEQQNQHIARDASRATACDTGMASATGEAITREDFARAFASARGAIMPDCAAAPAPRRSWKKRLIDWWR